MGWEWDLCVCLYVVCRYRGQCICKFMGYVYGSYNSSFLHTAFQEPLTAAPFPCSQWHATAVPHVLQAIDCKGQ